MAKYRACDCGLCENYPSWYHVDLVYANPNWPESRQRVEVSCPRRVETKPSKPRAWSIRIILSHAQRDLAINQGSRI